MANREPAHFLSTDQTRALLSAGADTDPLHRKYNGRSHDAPKWEQATAGSIPRSTSIYIAKALSITKRKCRVSAQRGHSRRGLRIRIKLLKQRSSSRTSHDRRIDGDGIHRRIAIGVLPLHLQ